VKKDAHFAIHKTFLMTLMLHRRNQIEDEQEELWEAADALGYNNNRVLKNPKPASDAVVWLSS
jgi:hypothetical protein